MKEAAAVCRNYSHLAEISGPKLTPVFDGSEQLIRAPNRCRCRLVIRRHFCRCDD
jgi:hypothetical protein